MKGSWKSSDVAAGYIRLSGEQPHHLKSPCNVIIKYSDWKRGTVSISRNPLSPHYVWWQEGIWNAPKQCSELCTDLTTLFIKMWWWKSNLCTNIHIFKDALHWKFLWHLSNDGGHISRKFWLRYLSWLFFILAKNGVIILWKNTRDAFGIDQKTIAVVTLNFLSDFVFEGCCFYTLIFLNIQNVFFF